MRIDSLLSVVMFACLSFVLAGSHVHVSAAFLLEEPGSASSASSAGRGVSDPDSVEGIIRLNPNPRISAGAEYARLYRKTVQFDTSGLRTSPLGPQPPRLVVPQLLTTIEGINFDEDGAGVQPAPTLYNILKLSYIRRTAPPQSVPASEASQFPESL